jgi:hypothetical protein
LVPGTTTRKNSAAPHRDLNPPRRDRRDG